MLRTVRRFNAEGAAGLLDRKLGGRPSKLTAGQLGTPVQDVSANNDWSAVRVWYTPGKKYGVRTYLAHGFIYPESPMAANPAQQGFLADPAARPTGDIYLSPLRNGLYSLNLIIIIL